MAPQVSVIIPVYNGDRFVAQAIDSVLQQTMADCEIIVVDDGSTDCTADMLQGYGNSIRVIRQENQGVAIARNVGIQQAQADFIAFLDADDWFYPNKLEAQLRQFEQYPEAGLVHSGWCRVDAEGKPLLEVMPWLQVPVLNLESWLRWKPVLPSAMLFRKTWLETAGGFDPRFPPAEDTELVLRLAKLGCEAVWLKQITVGYRQHSDSAMHKGLPQAHSLAAVIDHFFAQPDLPPAIRWLEPQVRYNTLVWISWYLYETQHTDVMVDYLKRSRLYSPHAVVEMIVHWVDSFAQFSAAWGKPFDADALARSPHWQALMAELMRSPLVL